MIRYSCTNCQRKLLIKEDLAGQQSKCPCGASFTVPLLAEAVAPTPPISTPKQVKSETKSPPEAPPITIACTKCDRTLRAPASAAGKAVRCVCGSLVLVPAESRNGSTVVSVVQKTQGSDWLNELPPPPKYQAPAAESGAEFWYVDAEPQEMDAPRSTALPDARQASHEYIRNAEIEIREQRKRGQGEAAGSLGIAQGTLIFVGLLTIAAYTFLYFNATTEVQQEAAKGDVPMSQETMLFFVRVVYGSFIAIGVVELLLGALIYQFPLFCPLAGLIIYVGANMVAGVLNPLSLLKGIIIKVLVVIALVKAVNDGAYYRD